MLNTLNVDLKTDIKNDRPTALGIKLMSQDKNNNQFVLRFTNGGEPVALDDTYTVEILTKFTNSGASRLTSAIVRQDYATWQFDTAYITQDEKVTNYVYVRKSGSLVVSADANAFYFDVGLSEIDKNAGRVAEVYDENYQKYLDEFKDNVDFEEIAQAEKARKEAELLREENYNQKVDTAIVEADVVSKVDNKVTELTPQINSLTAQLEQTAKKDDVFSMANMGQDIKEAMTGDSVAVVGRYSVGEENLVKSAVQPEHTAFLRIGKNLFNKKDVTPSKSISVYNGEEQESALRDLSGYIPVLPNSTYSRKFDSIVVYFTAERTYISGVTNSGLTFTTPSNCHFIRVTTDSAGNRKEKEQIEIGGTSTEYEEFSVSLGSELNKVVLSKENLTDKIITDDMIDFDAVKIEHVDFIKQLPNLINKSTIKYNSTYNKDSYLDNNYFDSSDYIPVHKGLTYTFSKGARIVAFVDMNKTWKLDFLNNENYKNAPFTFTVNEDGYIVASIFKESTSEIVLNKGDSADINKVEYGYEFDRENFIDIPHLLSASEIEKTKKNIIFLPDGDISKVRFIHTETLGVMREDRFIYEENKITETRKLYNGSQRTIIYNLDTLETEVI